MTGVPTPGSLLDRIRAEHCDEQDIARLMDYCQAYLIPWSRRFLSDSNDQDDLVQEVFISVLDQIKAKGYDRNQRFRGLLFVTTRNRAFDFLRRRKCGPIIGLSSSEVSTEPPIPELDEAEFRAHLVQRAMAIMKSSFTESTWRAALLVTQEGKTAEETAGILGISVAAVYMAKSRVLKRLREELHDLLD